MHAFTLKNDQRIAEDDCGSACAVAIHPWAGRIVLDDFDELLRGLAGWEQATHAVLPSFLELFVSNLGGDRQHLIFHAPRQPQWF